MVILPAGVKRFIKTFLFNIYFSLDTVPFRAQPAAISVPFVLSLAIPVIRLSVPKLASAKPTTPGPVLNLTVSKSRAPFSSRPRMDIFPARPETCLTRFARSVAKRASIFRYLFFVPKLTFKIFNPFEKSDK